MTLDLQATIEKAWDERANLSPADARAEIREAVEHALDALNSGRLCVAEKINDDWVVHQWLKKAVLLSFRLNNNVIMGESPLQFNYKKTNEMFRLRRNRVQAKRLLCGSPRRQPPRRLYRPQRHLDALVCQHRGVC